MVVEACNRVLNESGSVSNHAPFSLLALPLDLLHLVLGMLAPGALRTLLQCSKTMAQLVMQHNPGRGELQVQVQPYKKWAATRHLLQWLPPSCLKVRLHCDCPQWHQPCACHTQLQLTSPCPSTTVLASLMATGTACTAMSQQFLCLTELCLQGLVLPSVVPPGLADTCPNVHTLVLDSCRVVKGSKRSNKRKSISASKHAAASIQCLRLLNVRLPLLDGSAVGAAMQRTAFARQLQASLPNLSCLVCDGLDVSDHGIMLWKLWACQLTELHVDRCNGWASHWSDFRTATGQLQRLHLPDNDVLSLDDLLAILEMRLTHVEVGDIVNITEDLSDHPCTWQYLRISSLCHLLDLAYVPLHSLTSPLVSGYDGWSTEDLDVDGPLLYLPGMPDTDDLTRLQQLRKQLTRCGVQLLPPVIAYGPLIKGIQGPPDAADSSLAESLSIKAPAFAASQRIWLKSCEVGLQVLQALAAAHQHRLRWLTLLFCYTQFRTQAAWDVLLSGLPLLDRVELWSCQQHEPVDWDDTLAEEALPSLCAAMAQQPKGRIVEVWFCREHMNTARDVFDAMMSGQLPIPAEVELTSIDSTERTTSQRKTPKYSITAYVVRVACKGGS